MNVYLKLCVIFNHEQIKLTFFSIYQVIVQKLLHFKINLIYIVEIEEFRIHHYIVINNQC